MPINIGNQNIYLNFDYLLFYLQFVLEEYK